MKKSKHLKFLVIGIICLVISAALFIGPLVLPFLIAFFVTMMIIIATLGLAFVFESDPSKLYLNILNDMPATAYWPFALFGIIFLALGIFFIIKYSQKAKPVKSTPPVL